MDSLADRTARVGLAGELAAGPTDRRPIARPPAIAKGRAGGRTGGRAGGRASRRTSGHADQGL